MGLVHSLKIRRTSSPGYQWSSGQSHERLRLRILYFLFVRHVYFRYPGSDINALQDVSFKLEAGQLCVSKLLVSLDPIF